MNRDNSLSQYSDACQLVADKYIERSTRFGAADLKVLNVLPNARNFKIKIRYSLKVISEAKDHKGVIKPGANDFLIADWGHYQDQVKKQAEVELARKETLEDLVSTVKAQRYAAISEKLFLRSHPRSLFHTYKCGTCQGVGQVSCSGCAGLGVVFCGNCAGRGQVTCSSCHGSRSVYEHVQVRNHAGQYRMERQHRHCFSCSGGKVTCSGCGGSGRITCKTCSGSGKLTCETCAGQGYLTRITSTNTYTLPEFTGIYPPATPNYVHEALNMAGFSNLERYGVIHFENVDVFHEHVSADFIYGSIINFCELSLKIADSQSALVLYGSPPQIHDAGGILEPLLKNDFDRLIALGTGWSYMLPWFHRRARSVVAPFMESEIHQEILNADSQGLALSMVVEKVKRSLSEGYIEMSLIRLRKTVQTVVDWSSLKWTIGIALSSIPLIVSAISFMERSESHTMLAMQDRLVIFPVGGVTEVPWNIVAFTIPLSLSGWLVAKLVSKRWINGVGGKPLVDWASKKGLLIGKWMAGATIIASAVTATSFFNKWPIWMDREGRLYGTLAIFQVPQIIESTILQKKKQTNRHASQKAIH